MKLSASTLSVLKNFAAINQSIQFKDGNVIRTISPSKSILAKATLEDSFDSTFAIYDLPRFLGVLSLFDTPEFEVHESFVRVKSPGRFVDYMFADPSTLILPPDRELKIDEFDVSFELKSAHLIEIMKALGVLSLPDLLVVGENGHILLRAGDSRTKGSNHYDIELGETDKIFTAIFKTENLKIASDRDYSVVISSKGISRFSTENLEYFVAIESNSSFE